MAVYEHACCVHLSRLWRERPLRELASDGTQLAGMELVEVQIAQHVLAVARNNMKQAIQSFNNLARDINQSKEILQAYENAINSKMANDKSERIS